jgi:pantothenate synthetase
VTGEEGVRRARLCLHRAEDALTVATASLRDAALTATVRDELAGSARNCCLRRKSWRACWLLTAATRAPGDSLLRAHDGENAALRRAVRQVLLAMDAGEITELEAAHLIADAVDLHRRNSGC